MIFLGLTSSFSLAASDDEYKLYLTQSKTLNELDAAIKNFTLDLRKKLSKDEYKIFLEDQRDWIKNRRLTEVEAMKQKMSALDAYISSTSKRLEYLRYKYAQNKNTPAVTNDNKNVQNDQKNVNPESERRVTVEAEGIGITKIDAVKEAWMEAVRKGVGMYIASKTETINDSITEKIVAHSRGEVNSYKILSAQRLDDGWHVKISANIDRDILEDPIVTTNTKTSDFDPNDLISSLVTKEQKLQSAMNLIDINIHEFDITNCFNYTFKIKKDKDKNNNENYYAYHQLSMDINKYTKRIDAIMKLLEQVAEKKINIRFDDKASQNFKTMIYNLVSNKNKYRIYDINNNDSLMIPEDAESIENNSFYNQKDDKGYIFIVTSPSKAIVYVVDKSITKKLIKVANLEFSIDSGRNVFQEIAEPSKNIPIFTSFFVKCIFDRWNNLKEEMSKNDKRIVFLFPFISLYPANGNLKITTNLIYRQKLNITSEMLKDIKDLDNIKNIKGSYKLYSLDLD